MEISKITDFGDLKDDETIQNKLQNFHSSVEKIGKLLDIAFSNDLYDKMTVKEKVDYDLFVNYALNTLFWLYLRCKGEDPNSNDIKHQLTRIKEYMMKAKQVQHLIFMVLFCYVL